MKATIMIPAYNAEKFLVETLNSALYQTFQDYEVLAINDGSKDSTPKILDRYQRMMPKQVRVLHQENAGVGTTRNRLLDNSQGEIILGLDADDILHPEALEKVITHFDKHPQANFVYTDHTEITEEGAPIKTMQKAKCHAHFKDTILHCHFPGHLRAFRKDAVKNARFNPELKMSEDYDFLLKVILQHDLETIAGHVSEPLYFYRMNNASITHNTKSFSQQVLEEHLRKNKVYNGQDWKVVPTIEAGFTFWDHEVNGKRIMKSESKKALVEYLQTE